MIRDGKASKQATKMGKLLPNTEKIAQRLKKPAQFVVDAIPIFEQCDFKRILDLGCGVGRHCVYLADKGFNVVGIDISRSALMMAGKWGQKEGLASVGLIQAAMTSLPFRDRSFDAIISVSVIHHAVIGDIKTTIDEIYWILNKNGLFLANLASVDDPRYGTGESVEENTFRIPEAFEEKRFEELHHFSTEGEVIRLLASFGSINVELLKDKPHYWRIMASK